MYDINKENEQKWNFHSNNNNQFRVSVAKS